MNAQLQNISALSQLMPQQDPMQALSGLLQLIGGVDQLGYQRQDQQLQMNADSRQAEAQALEMELASRGATRADQALGLDRTRLIEEGRQGKLNEKKSNADMAYQRSAMQQGQQEIALRGKDLALRGQAYERSGLDGLLELLMGSAAGMKHPQLIEGLLRLAIESRGIELPSAADPDAAKRAALEAASGSNQMFGYSTN